MQFEQLEKRLVQSYEKIGREHRVILVGCSAGADSMALIALLMAAFKQRHAAPQLGLAHVNFGLRGNESDGDQQLVEQFAKEHGLLLHILSIKQNPLLMRRSGEGIQQWARRIRYDWFAQLAQQHDALIALAHHEDDVAENVLLRMARGSGTGQLAGMVAFAPPYWRPLLGVSKRQLLDFVTRQTIPHHFDSSNDKLDYSRNRVRHLVMKELEHLYPGAAGRIARMAFEAADIAQAVREHLIDHCHGNHEGSTRILDATWLQGVSVGVALEAVSDLIKSSTNEHIQLSRTQLYMALDALQSEHSRQNGWCCEVYPGGYLTIKGDDVFVRDLKQTLRGPRYLQHTRKLSAWSCQAQLAQGAALELGEGDETLRFKNSGDDGCQFEILPIDNSNEPLFSCAGSDISWCLSDLQQIWRTNMTYTQGVKIDGRWIGVIEGNQIVAPGHDGAKRVVCGLNEVLRSS